MHNLNLGLSNNPPYDDRVRVEIENRLNIKFPNSYIELLKSWNGGYIETSYIIKLQFPIPKNLEYYLREGFWGISSIAGIMQKDGYQYSLKYLLGVASEWGLPHKLIPLEGDGHTWVAFDFRDDSLPEPPIVFLESDGYLTYKLADTFGQLLARFIPYEEVYDDDGNVRYNL